MALDGEWRNAFIADDEREDELRDGALPGGRFASSDLYGSGQIGGDVVGIPSNAKNADSAWLLLKYLALDTQAEVKLATILKNVPTTFESLKDPTLNSDPHFKVFLQIFGNPHSSFKADHAHRRHRFDPLGQLRRQVGGRSGARSAGRPAGARDTDRPAVPARVTGGSAWDGRHEPRAVAGAPEGAPATCAAALPHGVRCSCRRGSSGSCGSTCIRCSRACTTRSRTTTAVQPPRWTGLTNYRFMFTQDPLVLAVVAEHDLDRHRRRAAHDPLRRRHGVVLTKPRRGSSFYRLAFFVPTMVPAVAASLAFLFLLNPSGPIDTALRFLHVPQPLWFQDPAVVQARSRPAGSVGGRQHDDHLPGGAAGRPDAPVRGGRHRGRERLGRSSATSPCR